MGGGPAPVPSHNICTGQNYLPNLPRGYYLQDTYLHLPTPTKVLRWATW